MASRELESVLELIPKDFADPAADYRAVRAMFAPFHGHPVPEDFEVAIESNLGFCDDPSAPASVGAGLHPRSECRTNRKRLKSRGYSGPTKINAISPT